jgi:hypothetical protein
MKTQAALHLFQYWNRLRGSAAAPRRTHIEPSDIRDVLSQTFILENHPQNADMQFRLAGTAISTLFGRTLRNTAFRTLFQNQHRPVISRLARNCYHDSAVVLLGLDGVSLTGRQTVLEVVLLPLQDEANGQRILGCVAPHQHQFWHGLDPLKTVDLHSIRVVDPNREPLFLSNRPEVDLVPALAPVEDHLLGVAGATRKGVKLLVIQGGKSLPQHQEITKR